MPTPKKTYKVVCFYARAHQPSFPSKEAAMRHIQARALTRHTACYTELWEMTSDEDGECVALFDYGCTQPQQLVLKLD